MTLHVIGISKTRFDLVPSSTIEDQYELNSGYD